jgi:D-glycero-D-manno-heptose 1,7-bisphosphate phosphatase
VVVVPGAVFLDRDGVLNAAVVRDRRPYPPATPADVMILPGVRGAIDTFRAAGLMSVVVTNQPDIARGMTTADDVAAINNLVTEQTGVDAVVVCPHDDADDCMCRKPRPGMILAAAAEHGVDLRHSVMVGDRWRDIEAGQAALLPTVFVDRRYDERRPRDASLVVGELAEAVPWILKTTTRGQPQ